MTVTVKVSICVDNKNVKLSATACKNSEKVSPKNIKREWDINGDWVLQFRTEILNF